MIHGVVLVWLMGMAILAAVAIVSLSLAVLLEEIYIDDLSPRAAVGWAVLIVIGLVVWPLVLGLYATAAWRLDTWYPWEREADSEARR